MKNYFRLSALLLLAGTLLLSACKPQETPANTETQSQPDNTVSTGAALDACTLFTKADAEAILGKAVKEPEHPVEGSEVFNVTSCSYKVQEDGSIDHASLIVTAPSNGDLESAKNAFTQNHDQAQSAFGAVPVDVPGLGDAAYWIGGTYGNQLGILKGNVHLILTADSQKGDTPPQPLIDLAKIIVSRLP